MLNYDFFCPEEKIASSVIFVVNIFRLNCSYVHHSDADRTTSQSTESAAIGEKIRKLFLILVYLCFLYVCLSKNSDQKVLTG